MKAVSGENYRYARERLQLETWDTDREAMICRTPTNAELLTLLDALHADITGTTTAEYDQHLTERWYNS